MASITERKKLRSGAALTKIDRGRHPIKMSNYCRWKQGPDRVLAVLLLLPAMPLIALLILLVRLTSRGPGIYRQVRVGRNGKTFTMYKIRTMRHDAEARTGPTWATNNDPRLTGLGRFIRSVHLDELPQLINVLKGDMDLVGPRPERPPNF
jgi:lipopolysaccharide/colanic/teichoic acid biosynthesis glycosyltransferase